MDGASSVHRQVVDIAVMLRRQVVDFPVMAQLQIPLVSFSRPLRFPSLQYIDGVIDVLVAQVQQICAKLWEIVEIPQLQLVSPGQVVARPLCATTSAHGR